MFRIETRLWEWRKIEFPIALASFGLPGDYSARSSRARTYTITNDAMGQNRKEIASVWGTYQIGATPADEDEWQDSLRELMEKVILKEDHVYEGILNIKHVSWKPKLAHATYFFRALEGTTRRGANRR